VAAAVSNIIWHIARTVANVALERLELIDEFGVPVERLDRTEPLNRGFAIDPLS